MSEISRVSNRYVAALEYHSDFIETTPWRGREGLIWKQDFEKAYMYYCHGMKPVQNDILEINEEVYGKRGLFYKHFLIEKCADFNK